MLIGFANLFLAIICSSPICSSRYLGLMAFAPAPVSKQTVVFLFPMLIINETGFPMSIDGSFVMTDRSFIFDCFSFELSIISISSVSLFVLSFVL